jgi:hypothetical protein
MEPKEIFANTVSILFGLALVYFSYTEFFKQEEEAKPKIGFDISTDASLLYSMGDPKSPSIDSKSNNIFLVIKNIGSNPIYDILVKLTGDHERTNHYQDRRILNLPSLLPGEYRLFNTGITPKGLEQWEKALCEVTCKDNEFSKEYKFTYDLLLHRKEIIAYLEQFSQNNEMTAIRTYQEIVSLRTGTPNQRQQQESLRDIADAIKTRK